MQTTSQWCDNKCDGISNHQHLNYLLNRLFRHKSKKTSKFGITGLCVWGNSLVTGDFHTQRSSNVENVSIWWCHHDTYPFGVTHCILITEFLVKNMSSFAKSTHYSLGYVDSNLSLQFSTVCCDYISKHFHIACRTLQMINQQWLG